MENNIVNVGKYAININYFNFRKADLNSFELVDTDYKHKDVRKRFGIVLYLMTNFTGNHSEKSIWFDNEDDRNKAAIELFKVLDRISDPLSHLTPAPLIPDPDNPGRSIIPPEAITDPGQWVDSKPEDFE